VCQCTCHRLYHHYPHARHTQWPDGDLLSNSISPRALSPECHRSNLCSLNAALVRVEVYASSDCLSKREQEWGIKMEMVELMKGALDEKWWSPRFEWFNWWDWKFNVNAMKMWNDSIVSWLLTDSRKNHKFSLVTTTNWNLFSRRQNKNSKKIT
jgi:hypothetical protein